jgi:transposase-like protein
LSKSTASRICAAIRDEFDVWRRRDLSDVELEYLYLDGSHFRYHAGARAEPVLYAWGITTIGAPVFLALDGASSESHDACTGFLRDLVARGLRPPLLVITDGAPRPNLLPRSNRRLRSARRYTRLHGASDEPAVADSGQGAA